MLTRTAIVTVGLLGAMMVSSAQAGAVDVGDWVVSTYVGQTVYHFDSSGTFIEKSADLGAAAGAVDIGPNFGNVYNVDRDQQVNQFLASDFSQSVVIDPTSGDQTTWVSVGPNGHIYVGTKAPEILEWDASFAPLGQYVDLSGHANPNDLVWGPDGALYIGGNDSMVRRFDGTTLSIFVDNSAGALTEVVGLAFGSDGNLYVSDASNNTVTRYQGPAGSSPGAFIDTFVPAGSGGLSAAQDADFGLDGHLYVVSLGTDTIKRYNGTTGAYMGDFASVDSGDLPIGIAQQVPEPATLLLLLAGGSLSLLRRRR